jgi:hypothetical protein
MKSTRSLQATALLAVALCSTSVARAQGAPLRVLGYTTTVPSAWIARPAASTMRLADYSVGPGSAQVVVYFFGQGQGGAVAPNMTRWKSQFSNPDGSPVEEIVSRDSSGAFPITFAEYHGTYARGVGAGSTANAQPNQALVAGIAETPKGTLFIQLFGPAADVAAARKDFVGFVRGLR